MRRAYSRWLLPILLILGYLCVGLAAEDEQARTVSADSAANVQQHAFNSPLKEDVKAKVMPHDYGTMHENEMHDEDTSKALNLLRTIDVPRSRSSRIDRPSGTAGTFYYYLKKFFVLLFMTSSKKETDSHSGVLRGEVIKAVGLLKSASLRGDADALMILADMNFHGHYGYPQNFSEALRLYSLLAEKDGNSTAQHMVGLLYATGIGASVNQDQARSTLYYLFAAKNGNLQSEMTIAYRQHMGIGMRRNCEEAVKHYQNVADAAIDFVKSGPPGGRTMIKDSFRLADDEGGVYGEGASVVSSGYSARSGGYVSDTQTHVLDILEYLDLMSRTGDLKATFKLGAVHYDGSKSVKRDFVVARKYFMDVARKYWTKDGSPKADFPPGADKWASQAAGYIGRMFLRGEGTEQNFAKAKIWFDRGVRNGDALCQYSLGIMYLNGFGVTRNPIKAADLFGAAADQDMTSAQVRLGALFLDQGDVQTAMRYFDLAVRNGHIEAYYYLAEMNNKGIGRSRSCTLAATYYKIVAEKAEALLADFEAANEAYEDGNKEAALLAYLLAAEQGFESAQANVAWILDQSRSESASKWSLKYLPSTLKFSSSKPEPSSSTFEETTMALTYWTRSAKELNIDSLVKMGDYYLDGLGVPSDSEKAAACYQAAADTSLSAQAMWNLGWMHENGIGIEQDFHLAKRMYDLALESSREAYLPVKLALLKLRLRSWWNSVTGGDINSIEDGEDEEKRPWSFSEWINAILDNEAREYLEQMEQLEQAGIDPEEYGMWENGIVGDDDLYADLEEGFIETLVIIGLAAFLALLVYYRQQRELNRRLAEEQQRRQQQEQAQHAEQPILPQQPDPGMFPPPGDLAFNGWGVGGIGQ